jgi:hypothetical protein
VLPLGSPAGDAPCQLVEPDQKRLTDATLQDEAQAWVVLRLERPGRMIERALVGNARRMLLSIAGGRPRWTEINWHRFGPCDP